MAISWQVMALVSTLKFVRTILLYVNISKPNTERTFWDIWMMGQPSLIFTEGLLLATTHLDVEILGGIHYTSLKSHSYKLGIWRKAALQGDSSHP